jgi:hypothetical protein
MSIRNFFTKNISNSKENSTSTSASNFNNDDSNCDNSNSTSSTNNLNKDPSIKINFQNTFEYSITYNSAFCFYSPFFPNNSYRNHPAISSKGFTDFKKATQAFNTNEGTSSHKACVISYHNKIDEGQ